MSIGCMPTPTIIDAHGSAAVRGPGFTSHSRHMISFPKPTKRPKRYKKMALSDYARRRSAHRALIWERDNRRCRCCGRGLSLSGESPFAIAQIHEEPSRAQGGNPLDPKQTITLCAVCHQQRTEHRIRLEIVDPELGCGGEVRFVATS